MCYQILENVENYLYIRFSSETNKALKKLRVLQLQRNKRLRTISSDPNSIAFQRKNEISLTEICVYVREREREREREKHDCKIRKWVTLAQTNTVKQKFQEQKIT